MHRLLISLISLLLFVAPVSANDEAETARKIKSLQSSIALLESRLSRQKKDAKDLHQTLKSTELRISKLHTQLGALDQQLARLGSHAGKLESKRDALRAELKRRGEVIGRQFRAQYKMGEKPWLQAFLMQEDPDEFARMMTYFGRVNSELLRQIETFRDRLNQLNGTEAELGSTEQEMVIKRRQLSIESAKLSTAQKERQTVLAELELDIARDSKRLSGMQADQTRLAELLETLQDTIEQLSLDRDGENFSGLRRKLAWPVTGRVLRSYGSLPDKVGYDGIWIAATSGTAVKAVHHGRVVFSSWLDGYGLVIIIDHGGNYMSVYGYNNTLIPSVGEWVSSGDVIATVGDTGGQPRTGLFFGIRYSARPNDPIAWLKRR